MDVDDQQRRTESALAAWRSSYRELRRLERQLVTATAADEDPAKIDKLYQMVEALRAITTDMFAAAQLASVSCHVNMVRTSTCLAEQNRLRLAAIGSGLDGQTRRAAPIQSLRP